MNTILLATILTLTLTKGVMYLITVRTFEMARIPNSIIFFAVRTSSIITGAYYCYMAIYCLLLLVAKQDLWPFMRIFFIPFIFINGLYGFAWIANYLFVKKRSRIGLLGIFHLLSFGLSFVFLVMASNLDMIFKPFHFPYLTLFSVESRIITFCILFIIPLVIWHLIAPFLMNWKMWLAEREFNVLSESFIIFFCTAFTLSHPLINVYFYFLYKKEFFNYYLLFLILFILFASLEVSLWFTYSPQTRYFKSFKYKLLPVMIPIIALCIVLLLINVL